MHTLVKINAIAQESDESVLIATRVAAQRALAQGDSSSRGVLAMQGASFMVDQVNIEPLAWRIGPFPLRRAALLASGAAAASPFVTLTLRQVERYVNRPN